jgi:hypothetical protein
MGDYMQNRVICFLRFALIGSFLVLPSVADQKPATFAFGGKQLYVGMSEHDAVAALAVCCRLSPPAEADVEKKPTTEGIMPGHFILTKEDPPQGSGILGTVHFVGGKIMSITRPLDDEIDTQNDHVVAFARAFNRALSPTMGDGETTVRVSVLHERLSNGQSDALSLTFPNGRGIRIRIGTLDKADTTNTKRDFATLDETLEPARPN